MTIRHSIEIGELVIVAGANGGAPIYGRIVGRYFGREASLFDVQPEGERELKARLHGVEEYRISKANSEVARMVAAYNKPVSEKPKHVRDEI